MPSHSLRLNPPPFVTLRLQERTYLCCLKCLIRLQKMLYFHYPASHLLISFFIINKTVYENISNLIIILYFYISILNFRISKSIVSMNRLVIGGLDRKQFAWESGLKYPNSISNNIFNEFWIIICKLSHIFFISTL